MRRKRSSRVQRHRFPTNERTLPRTTITRTQNSCSGCHPKATSPGTQNSNSSHLRRNRRRARVAVGRAGPGYIKSHNGELSLNSASEELAVPADDIRGSLQKLKDDGKIV